NVFGFAGGVFEGLDEFTLPNFVLANLDLNTPNSLALYYATSNQDPALAASSFVVNHVGIGVQFGSLTFVPVPEPSGALLVMSAGLACLVRRRLRR
ncbi:MAG TPA: PEP-CTERM sorting domain-containing protein, partial [Verrucomicrobium sp.]|nr:PEP-CTERM sorting domain-containing protein [Verrucomicrobium sp.]